MARLKKKLEHQALRLATSKANIYKTHPNLYISIMIMALMCLALALNLYLSKPTFTPYGLKNELIGSVFLIIGICKIVFLNFYRNLKLVRIIIAIAMAFMIFWGISNTQQFFLGKASLQLPILYISLAVFQLPLLWEPSIQPMTRIKK